MSRDLDAQLQSEQLHRAAQEGDIARVKELIARKYPVNSFDYLGNTPLHYAVRAGSLDVVDCLIKASGNVNAHDERWIGNTPLSDNAQVCSFEIAKRLISAGADPTIPGWMQLNAIDRAAKRTDGNGNRIGGQCGG